MAARPAAAAALALMLLICSAAAFVVPLNTKPAEAVFAKASSKEARPVVLLAVSTHKEVMTTDRRRQLERVALAGLGLVMAPSLALADSTGKYSTKQTAKKRYLPRVRKGVRLFVDLEKQLDKPDAIQAFNQFLEDNLSTALSLFGASTRIGELPDAGSRTVDAEVADFIKFCKALGKAKDAGEAKATYEQAKMALVAYLKATKLEKIGDPVYNQ